MLAFAKRRKEQRVARGCLTLASAEVKFEFDSETHENITDVHEYAPRSRVRVSRALLLSLAADVRPQVHSVRDQLHG